VPTHLAVRSVIAFRKTALASPRQTLEHLLMAPRYAQGEPVAAERVPTAAAQGYDVNDGGKGMGEHTPQAHVRPDAELPGNK
jgi:hypothetical protein